MPFDIHIGPWDVALAAVVSLQATLLAYVHNPKWKGFVLSLPVPFTMASLSLGRPVDATNMVGALLLLAYTHAVRLLYVRAGVPIILSIVISAGAYCVAGSLLATVLPQGDAAFWISAACVFIVGLVLYKFQPHREEPGHRSPLPVWIKLPIIVGVVSFLVVMKQYLRGFMTVFPMVGLVAAYEARKSLWTITRSIPFLMLPMVPMLSAMRLVQGSLGQGRALAIGWAVFLSILLPLARKTWFKAIVEDEDDDGQPNGSTPAAAEDTKP